ncbi:MAG: glutathione S-transferase N-terminal domain-containing protein [Sphingomonadales bacterium]|nr:glutathione S-transferase N-terminal domain-containing protein [Sphingomonadales bacterium]
MIDLYYWPTPNGWKITIMLEECGLPYTLVPVNIGAGEQFKPDFLKISPNNRMPAIVDHAAAGGPLSIFESGAILLYLAEKTGRFLPTGLHGRFEVMQWLFWQVAGLGPMAGQLGHFRNYSTEKIAYAITRYQNEYNRLLGVLDRRLADRPYLAGDYSIADMAAWPWVRIYERLGETLDSFPHVARWHEAIAARPAARKGVEIGRELRQDTMTEEARKVLFGQTADSIRKL